VHIEQTNGLKSGEIPTGTGENTGLKSFTSSQVMLYTQLDGHFSKEGVVVLTTSVEVVVTGNSVVVVISLGVVVCMTTGVVVSTCEGSVVVVT